MKKVFFFSLIFILFAINIFSLPPTSQILSLKLKDAIRIGIENNLLEKLNKAEEEELKYQIGKVESLFWPKLHAQYSYNITSYSKELETYFNSVFSSPYIGFTNTSKYTNLLRVFLETFIYTWGKNTRKKRIAQLNLQIQQLLNQKDKQQLIFEISQNYFKVLFNKIMFSAVAEYLGSFKLLYNHIKSEEEKLILNENYGFFTQKLYQYENELSLSKIYLKRAMGIGNLSPEVSIDIEEKFLPVAQKKFQRDAVLATAAKNRIEKNILEKQEKILQNKISILKKSYMPDIKLISEWDLINYQDSDIRPLVEQNTQSLVAIQVDLPIFDGFSKANEIRSLEQKQKQIKLMQKSKMRDIVSEVDSSLLQVQHYLKIAEALTISYKATKQLLDNKVNSLNNKTSLSKKEIEKIASLYLKSFKIEEERNIAYLNYNLALIKLYQVMGIISPDSL